MSELFGDANSARAEQSHTWRRIIDEVSLDGDVVRLKLTQDCRSVSGAYVLCSFDDIDGGESREELPFEISLTEVGTIPDSFAFPRTGTTFSFRLVISEPLGSEEVHTIQPGLVQGEIALVLDTGWSFATPQ